VLNETIKKMFETAPVDLTTLDYESLLAEIDAVFAVDSEDTVNDVRDLFVGEIERLIALIRTHLIRWVGNPRPTKTRIRVMREAFKLISRSSHMHDEQDDSSTAEPNLQTQFTNAVDGLLAAKKALEDAELRESADAELRRLATRRDLSLPTERSESRLVHDFVRGCELLTITITEDAVGGLFSRLLSGMARHETVEPPNRALLERVHAVLPDLELLRAGSVIVPHETCYREMQL